MNRKVALPLAASLLALFACAAPAAAVAAPPTLTGEELVSTGGATDVACQSFGDFSFNAAGPASGPYEGAFTEIGTGRFDAAPDDFGGSVTAFSSAFTISSTSGALLAKGTLTQQQPGGFGCREDSGAVGVGGYQVAYSATLYTSAGSYHDEGTVDIGSVFSTGGQQSPDTSTFQTFTSSLAEPTPLSPTDKSQCKNGGYLHYPQFKNQGACVSFVASGR